MSPARHPAALLAALDDPVRRRVYAAAALGAGTAEELAAAAGVEVDPVRRAVDRLVDVGLLRRAGADRVEVVAGAFKEAAGAVRSMRPMVDAASLGATPDQAEVLRPFLVDGALTAIPTKRRIRMVLLDFLAARFEPGRTYPERRVNDMLRRFHPDVAALRRYLVDEGFLERRGGFYWRAGGTFEVE